METVFAVCFLFGALFTVASLLVGVVGSGLRFGQAGHGVHIGHHGPGGHDVHMPHGHSAPLSGAGHAPDTHAAGAHHTVAHSEPEGGHVGLQLLNASSLLAFLTWFGAAGLLLTKVAEWPAAMAFAGAIPAGAVGGLLVSLVLRKILSGERELDPRDFRREGTMARVTVSIPAGGVGEVVFPMGGTRRSEAARALGNAPIPRETEVVIIEYERGVATVEPLDEFLAQSGRRSAPQSVPPAGAGS
ncbi:MAG: hypothetical protein HYX51_05480 [Chloroflexi bacterium]|nr:hypothetical protein [Chloroflexota bacterium]